GPTIPPARLPLLALAALGSGREPIAVDTRNAASIPAEIALAGLRDLLPKALYLGCGEPTISFMQSDIKSWSIDEKGVGFQPKSTDPYRMPFSSMKGTELTKVPLSYEVRIRVGASGTPPKDFFRFNWREEET